MSSTSFVFDSEGRVSEIGTFGELLKAQGAFAEFLEQHLLEEAKQKGSDEVNEDVVEGALLFLPY